MTNQQKIEKPQDGYLTDYQYQNVWRKAVKFPTGNISYYDKYDIIVEGVTFQNPETIIKENIVLVPESEDIAWNSRIGIYGAIGTLPSEIVYLEGSAIRPFGGKIQQTNTTTRIVFEEGTVSRYENYEAVINGKTYKDLLKELNDNAINLTRKVDDSAGIIVSGLNDRGKPVHVFEKDSEQKPLNGFVIFHGTTSTCIMFRKGDLTEYAAGYKLYYEDTFTTAAINLEPIHIRFESVGKNIYSEVKLVTLDNNGLEGEILFQGRYNEQFAANNLAGEAVFYRQLNFGGTAEKYNIGADVTFWDGDNYNDKYLSLQVSGNTKVHCYQHSQGTGIYKVYTQGNHPSLTEMSGLSKFWVGLGDWAIAFRTEDNVDNTEFKADRFRSHIAVAGLGIAISESEAPNIPIEEKIFKQLAGKEHISEINCAINVFHKKTNTLVSSGQVIFHYNRQNGIVSVIRQSFADINVQASIKSVDNTRFEIFLEKKEGVEPPDDGYMGLDRAVWNGNSILVAEGWGTPGGTIWAVTNTQSEKIATSNGNYWRYDSTRPRYGIKPEQPYLDGKRRFTFHVEQRDAAPTWDSRDLLYAAPIIESPYDGETVPSILPEFIGTAYYHPSLKPTVLLTDGKGNELGRTLVEQDGQWRLQPTHNLPSGIYELTVELVFSEDEPITNQFKAEVKTHLIYVQ